MIEAVKKLFNEHCPLCDPLYYDLTAWFVVHTYGAHHLNHPSHLSITGPDDFANNRLGKIMEAIAYNPLVTTFSDLSLRPGADQNKEIGTRIIYVEKKLRHSEEYERLCHLLCDPYLEDGKTTSGEPGTPVMIIGNNGFIDPKLTNRTIPLYVVPFTSHVQGFFYSKLKGEIVGARNSIVKFWKDGLSKILECYNNFSRPDWLKNQHEHSWLPILAPAEAYSHLLHQPTHFEQMLTLAEKVVTSRRMAESSIPLEQKVLEATLTFIRTTSHGTIKNHEGTEFYLGPALCEFIRKMTDLPQLRKEKISKILNDHDGVVVATWRPRIEVDDEKASTKDKQVKKIIQPTCYAINQERLAETLRNYRKSG